MQIGKRALAGVYKLMLDRGVQLLRLILGAATLHLDGQAVFEIVGLGLTR
ncbi:MAG TPA: hypothetical protein VIH71_08945 [Solirubrobacteraceae bacterium]